MNNKAYCHCNNTCIPCKESSDEITHVIILEKNQQKSRRCTDLIYSAYSFSGVKLGILN